MASLYERFIELESLISDPSVISDSKRYSPLLREHGQISKRTSAYRELVALEEELTSLQEMLEDSAGDEELEALTNEEISSVSETLEKEATALEDILLVEDEDSERNAIVEIRAGTGGDESALFVADLLRIYTKYCEIRGWKIEMTSSEETEQGGFREVVFCVSGDGVYRAMRYETGGHRVQRVPKTETQGRIHTSAVRVAVLPEAEEVDVQIDPIDLRIERTTSQGPGGQSVNTSHTAVRVTHIPSGIQVLAQEMKSQHRNHERAMHILRTKLYQQARDEADAERNAMRREQGSGDRSDRVRTYNYPQNRCTDHRLGENFSLEKVSQGFLEPLVEAMITHQRQQRRGE